MSNCYTRFSKDFVPLHEEQRAWLKETVAIVRDEDHEDREAVLEDIYPEDFDCFLGGVGLHWDSNDNTVTIASDESGNPDDALCLIAAAQRAFYDLRPWGFCWAFTDDRGPSSGGAAVVKNGVVTYMPNQHDWLREQGVEP